MALLANGDSNSGSGDDFGTGPGCGGQLTTFDDEAAATFFGAAPPFAGSFQPLSSLAGLDGGPAAGNFTFIFEDLDDSAGTSAIVDAVGATVTYRYKVRKKKPKPKKSGAAAAKKVKRVTRTGSKDVCVTPSLVVNNGPNDPPTSDRATLGAVAIATGALPRGAVVTDVDARVRMTHTYEGDIDFFLVSPTGGIVPLWNGSGESEDDFGSGATDCTGAFTVFDDEAGSPILGGTSPFAGSFTPLGPLAALDRRLAGGSWTLYVVDHYTGDRGVLHSAGLNIDYSYRVIKKPKKKK